MQVLPGVYLINGSPYGRHQNGYLIHREGATILVDSGDLEDAATLAEVERHAARWGFALGEASHILITHAHFDHASHAAELQRQGLKLVASPATAEALTVGDERCIGFAVQRPFESCDVDIVLQDGERLTVDGLGITGHAAPGHCDGLMIFEIELDSERLWFTGDLFEARPRHAWINLPWTGDPNFDPEAYIASLKRLRGLPRPDHILPGHGPAAIGEGWRLLDMAYNEALVSWR